MSASSSEETPVLPSLELFSLKGQNALITGGSRGIGAELPLLYQKQVPQSVLHSRTPQTTLLPSSSNPKVVEWR
jgi:2-deoxy-D-gluconate 3-dehydrogenase